MVEPSGARCLSKMNFQIPRGSRQRRRTPLQTGKSILDRAYGIASATRLAVALAHAGTSGSSTTSAPIFRYRFTALV